MPNASIKDEKVDKEVRKSGASKEKDDLLQRARKVGIEGRTKMTKSELIRALRTH